MIDLYQANCGKTLDQSYSFLTLSFEIKSQIMCYHHITTGHLILLKYRLVTKNSLAFLDFFSGVWELRVALLFFLKLVQVEYSHH